MKVLHIESGLGNQMLDYCDLLACRRENPEDDIYIETIIYDIFEAHKTISMWNGYELERIFGIREKNVFDLFSEKQRRHILEYVTNSRFWEDNWRYSIAITEAFKLEGLSLRYTNIRPQFTEKPKIHQLFANQFFRYAAKNLYYRLFPQKSECRFGIPEKIFYQSNENLYTGHFLKMMYKGNQIEKIDRAIRKAFLFPSIDEEKNILCAQMVQNKNCNSVAIHARRGDFLSQNKYCYEYGYFKRATRFIKKKVSDPVFLVFCDTESIDWVKQNYSIFGLDFKQDKIYFVDWNSGAKSYRDMQLMSLCKHNIITNSSFGWWGAYLNTNPDKITCAPDAKINTTHWF